jgi:hypothetical protein
MIELHAFTIDRHLCRSDSGIASRDSRQDGLRESTRSHVLICRSHTSPGSRARNVCLRMMHGGFDWLLRLEHDRTSHVYD